MKKTSQRIFLTAAGMILIIMLLAGCQEQTVSSSRKARIVAADENIQLKKQLENSKNELEEKKLRLAKCLEKKEGLDSNVKQGIQEIMDKIVMSVSDENKKLIEENAALKDKIAELQNKP